MRIIHIAAGIVRQGDKILLVHQQGKADPFPTWALPGGVVEEGEYINDALVREIREETGLEVLKIGSLAYVTQHIEKDYQSVAFVFEIAEWQGELKIADPDEVILDVAFVTDTVEKLNLLPYRYMCDPAIAYLKGEFSIGKIWMYREGTPVVV